MDENRDLAERLIAYLKEFVTDERWQTMNRVLDYRTRHLIVVLEDLYQPHNASAVLRSCDCFGIQDVHVIENEHTFDPSKSVTIGADQWLTLHEYKREETENTRECFNILKEQGYRLVATTPHTDAMSIEELPVEEKTALVFGTELEGLSSQALELADRYVSIPMYGFSESYNVSVSAALCLYELSRRMRASKDIDWKLTDEERKAILLNWLENSLRAGPQLKHKFLESEGN